MFFKIMVKVLLVTFIALVTLGGFGLYNFYNSIPVTPTANTEKTDAIIVLTGGKDRIAEGIMLLNKDYADKMLISGVSKSTKLEELLYTQNLPKEEAKKLKAVKVHMGRNAINTIGNAKETADWVKENNVKSIRLVTANYHMPRALVEFQKRLPETRIIAHPVFPVNFKRDSWRDDALTRRFIFAEYIKYLMALIGK